MAWRHRSPALPPGILDSRGRAQPGLLRLFSRARRHAGALLLLRLGAEGEGGRSLPPAFLEALAAEVRIGDLAWYEPGAEVFLLLEESPGPEALLARLRPRARQQGVELRGRSALFPRAGLTLEALLEEVAWKR